jgi:cell division protein FtsI (penicillin-binding protein 3)
MQSIVDDEVASTAALPQVESALAVVIDARDGHVLAMQSVSGDARDPELPARERRSHGSVGKTFTYAIALERGAITTSDRFEGAPVTIAGESIHDRDEHGVMSVEDGIAFSSNVAAVHVFERLGRADLAAGLRGLHLAVPDGADADDAIAARLAYGPALEATPLEIASAFAAVVDGGTYHAPWRDGESPTEGERVLSAETSAAMRALLEAAVTRDDGTGHLAAIEGARVGGKTGTMPLDAGWTHGCFVGAVPIDDPQIVVVVDVVASTSDYSGGTLAAPAFARIAERWRSDAR